VGEGGLGTDPLGVVAGGDERHRAGVAGGRALLEACGTDVRWMRDATRGGVATVLNELAFAAEVGIVLDEHAVPMQPAVGAACELLGIDPLYVANEGRFVAVVAAMAVDAALAALHSVAVGEGAAVVGDVVAHLGACSAALVRRPPDDRHARRRSPPPDLLTLVSPPGSRFCGN